MENGPGTSKNKASGDSNFAAVVIGSGFGGTIAALKLANFFRDRNVGEKVCLLERGQWWISPELPLRSQDERDHTAGAKGDNMREFLDRTNQPYDYWAHPDNIEGIVDLVSKARPISNMGLYDYRQLSRNVHAICASGVGGGSLVYSNVTLQPAPSVYKDWQTEKEGPEKGLGPYFDEARDFIGVNTITTVAGLGGKNVKLEKSRIFQEAARSVAIANQGEMTVTNYNPDDPDFGFAAPLSITDIPGTVFPDILTEIQTNLPTGGPGGLAPSDVMKAVPQLEKYADPNLSNAKIQQNVCQREGRCVLGCLPGARHTLNKRIVLALQDPKLSGNLEVKALCEAELIEHIEPDGYRIHYKEIDRKTGADAGKKVIETGILVLAAGTLGTNELLMKSAKGLALNEKVLGHGFSPNGDLLGFMKISDVMPDKNGTFLDITRGPINTSHAAFRTKDKDFAFTIEDTTISKMVAPFLATLFDLYVESTRRDGSILTRIRRRLEIIERYRLLGLGTVLFGLNLPRLQSDLTLVAGKFRANMSSAVSKGGFVSNKLVESLKGDFEDFLESFVKDHSNPTASPEERLSRFFVFSAMGLDKGDGILGLNESELTFNVDQVGPGWFERNRRIFENIIHGMGELAREIDPKSSTVYTPTWNSKAPDESSLVVLHPLGGASIGESADTGIVNSFGQVFRNDSSNRSRTYDYFYVMDGSIVPSALGVNSSLTIAALAMRCSEHLIMSIPQLGQNSKGPQQ